MLNVYILADASIAKWDLFFTLENLEELQKKLPPNVEVHFESSLDKISEIKKTDATAIIGVAFIFGTNRYEEDLTGPFPTWKALEEKKVDFFVPLFPGLFAFKSQGDPTSKFENWLKIPCLPIIYTDVSGKKKFQIEAVNNGLAPSGQRIPQIDYEAKLKKIIKFPEERQSKVLDSVSESELGSVILSKIIEKLIGNIETKSGGRLTSGASSKKIAMLKNLNNEITAKTFDRNSNDFIKYIISLLNICKMKRHRWDLWNTPHSEKEVQELLADMMESPNPIVFK